MLRQTIFTGFLKCGDILYTLMSGFDAGPPKGSKVMGIQCWFSALPLTCRDFSRFSEPFDDIMMKSLNSLQLYIEKRCF